MQSKIYLDYYYFTVSPWRTYEVLSCDRCGKAFKGQNLHDMCILHTIYIHKLITFQKLTLLVIYQ